MANIKDAVTASGVGPGGSSGGQIILIKSGTYYENVKFDVVVEGSNGGTWLIGMGRLVMIDGGTTGSAIANVGNGGGASRFINLTCKTTPGGGSSYVPISVAARPNVWVLFCSIGPSDRWGLTLANTNSSNAFIAFNSFHTCDDNAIQLEGQNNIVVFNEVIGTGGLYDLDQYFATSVDPGITIGNVFRSTGVTYSINIPQGGNHDNPIVMGNQCEQPINVVAWDDSSGIAANPIF